MDTLMDILKTIIEFALRLIHIFFAIFWIGATLYLVTQKRYTVKKSGDPEVDGFIDSVHGGGFSRTLLYQALPKDAVQLHWFRYQSLMTGITGYLLLAMLYWRYPSTLTKIPLDGASNMAFVILMILGSIMVYRKIWSKIPPGSRFEKFGFAISFFFLEAVIYMFCDMFHGRAAFYHVGAVLGTIMVTNVWFTIIPNQKKMVAAGRRGEMFDPILKLRSLRATVHNNYLTMPILMIMLGGVHYPTIMHGAPLNWVWLTGWVAVGMAAGWLIRNKL